MMETVLVVGSRGRPRTVAELAMQCDRKEFPFAADGEQPKKYWMAGSGRLIGSLPWLGTHEPPLTSLSGRAVLTVAASHCYAIVRPDDEALPAAWISVPLALLTVRTSDWRGHFRKWPSSIELAADGWTLSVADVLGLNPWTSGAKAGQELSLVSALQV